MPHIEHTRDLLELLDLEDVPARNVKEGDVIWAQGRVIQVTRIERTEFGPLASIDFERERCPGADGVDGYERSIALKPNALLKRIPPAWLKPTP